MLIRLNCLDWDKYFLHEQNADGPSFLTNWEDCFLLGALYSKTPNLGGEGWGRGSITCFQVRPCCSDLLFFLEIVKRFGARSPSLDPCTMLKWNLFTISHVNFDRNYGRPFGPAWTIYCQKTERDTRFKRSRGAEQSKTKVARHAWQRREKTLGTKIKNNYINYIRKSSKHPDRA